MLYISLKENEISSIPRRVKNIPGIDIQNSIAAINKKGDADGFIFRLNQSRLISFRNAASKCVR